LFAFFILTSEPRLTAVQYVQPARRSGRRPRRTDDGDSEHATLSILYRQTSADTRVDPDGSGPGRGFSLSQRQREIAKELRLYPGFQGDE
jgi:hypothetical protein